MADAFLKVVVAQRLGNTAEDLVSRQGLTGRAEVIVGAFDGEQRQIAHCGEIDRLAAKRHATGGNVMLEEHLAQRIDVKGFGHVEHREILVVERAEAF